MSSSVFIETASRRSSSLSVCGKTSDPDDELFNEQPSVGDANLVVVLKNDRVHVDSDGLERFIADKTISSLSVIRITSPTPSMVEEEEAGAAADAARSDIDSDDSNMEKESNVDISVESGSSRTSAESGNEKTVSLGEARKQKKSKKKNEIVGVQIENFLTREDAEKVMKSVMQKTGLVKAQLTPEEEHLIMVIRNDHCYTSWGSPSKDIDVAQVKENQSAGAANAKRQNFFKKLQEVQHKKQVTKINKYTDDEDDDLHTSNAEEEEDTDYESANIVSSDTDNDRASDLDFRVNNNSNSKKMQKKRKKRALKKARRSINSKGKITRRLSIDGEEQKVRARKPAMEPLAMRLDNTVRALPRSKVQPPPQVTTATCTLPNLMRLPQPPPLPADNLPVRPVATIPITLEKEPDDYIIVKNKNPCIPVKKTKPDEVREICINQNTNTSRSETTQRTTITTTTTLSKKLMSTQIMTQVVRATNNFVCLEPVQKNVLPTQLPMQLHSSTSELAEERDKQLDLIDSIVTHELQQTANNKQQTVQESKDERKLDDKSIPAIVKMLEGEDTHTSSFVSNNANINAVELMPAEILDHVNDLLENDPALQQVAMDDSVFSEHDEPEISVDDAEQTTLAPQISDIMQLETPVQREEKAAVVEFITSTPIRALEPQLALPAKETPSTPTTAATATTEDWKKVKLSNGRVISLPPMERPTTRARRRAETSTTTNQQATENTTNLTNTSLQSFAESSNASTTQGASLLVDSVSAEKKTTHTVAKETKPAEQQTPMANKSRSKKPANKSKLGKSGNESQMSAMDDTLAEAQAEVDDDDPNKLWCICRKPHGNRFMICCDKCENWYHGKCVGVSSAQGKVLEIQNKPWNCPQCVKKVTNGSETVAELKAKPKRKAPAKQLENTTTTNTSVVTATAADNKAKPVEKLQTHITQFLPVAACNDGFKNKTPAQKKIMHAFLSEPAATSAMANPPHLKQTGDPCLVCKHASRNGTIYCSDECIRRHVQNAVQALTKALESSKVNAERKGLFEEVLLMADIKPKLERVNVIERKSGTIISGAHAPTVAALKKWLQENPTYEVIMPGTREYIEIESKQNKQKQHVNLNKTLTPTKMIVSKVVVAKEATPPIKLVRQISNNSSSSGLSAQKFYKAIDMKAEATRTKTEQIDKTAKAAAPEHTVQTESIRDNVVKTLSASLRLRMNNADDAANFKLKGDEIEQFIHGVEEELYRHHNGESNSKYKARYRQLAFNIKDAKNQTLFRKIFYKEVTPKQLAHMSVEELASQELAQWRKQENQHQLDIIKKTELDMLNCSKNLVLKTHKGEEIIDLDHSDMRDMDRNFPVANEAPLEKSVETTQSEINDTFYEELQTSLTSKEANSGVENEQTSVTATRAIHAEKMVISNELDKEKKEESEKHKHKDKEREKNKERERDRHERQHKSREKQKSRKRSRSHSRSAERSQERQERPEKRHKSATGDRHRDKEKERKRHDERDRERERGRERDKERDKARTKDGEKERVKDVSKERKHSAGEQIANKTKTATLHKDKKEAVKKTQKPIESYSLIDQILESRKTVEEAANLVPEKKRENTDSPANLAVTATENKQLLVQMSPEQTVIAIPSPPEDAYARYIVADTPILWHGTLNMIDLTSFQIIINPFVGACQNMSQLLPTELDVVGRIVPETVWEYMLKIKKSPNKEIVFTQLLPASSEETEAYQNLLKYLDKRNRLGVIKTNSTQIKDFYMFPLMTGKSLPTVLQPMESHVFFEDEERPDMLIGIVIRILTKRLHTQSANSISTHSTKHRRPTEASVSSQSRKRHSNLDPTAKDDGFDIDEIIKAPIAGKMGVKKLVNQVIKPSAVATIDLDEPYSPGSTDEDLPLLPISNKTALKTTNTVDPEFKSKINELNKQIAAQEQEIARLVHVDQSSTATNVLANISIPSNLSQILASIKSKTAETAQAQPANLEAGTTTNIYQHVDLTDAADEEYNPEDDIAYAYSSSKIVKSLASAAVSSTPVTTTSRLATLSEAELLSMVPDDMLEVQTSSKKPLQSLDVEPPPPGV